MTAQPAVGESNSIQAVFISFSGNSLKENNVLWFCQTAHQDVLCDFLENPSSLTQMDSKQRNKECHLPPSHIPFWLELPFFFFFFQNNRCPCKFLLPPTRKIGWILMVACSPSTAQASSLLTSPAEALPAIIQSFINPALPFKLAASAHSLPPLLWAHME